LYVHNEDLFLMGKRGKLKLSNYKLSTYNKRRKTESDASHVSPMVCVYIVVIHATLHFTISSKCVVSEFDVTVRDPVFIKESLCACVDSDLLIKLESVCVDLVLL